MASVGKLFGDSRAKKRVPVGLFEELDRPPLTPYPPRLMSTPTPRANWLEY
jgi:hypothetical protein